MSPEGVEYDCPITRDRDQLLHWIAENPGREQCDFPAHLRRHLQHLERHNLVYWDEGWHILLK